jgi:hypothetical protein
LTGVSADTGGELVYFNAFPSPVSAKPFDSPIEITTTSLIRQLLGTAGSSSSPDQQPTARRSAVNTHRQQKHRTEQNIVDRQTRTHLYDETPEDPSQPGSPSVTAESPDAETQSARPLRDSNPQFNTRADTQKSHSPGTSGGCNHKGTTRRSHPKDPIADEALTVEEPFSTPRFSMTDTPDTRAPPEGPPAHQVFGPLLDTEPTPAVNEIPLDKDQWLPQRSEPLVDHPMETEMHHQAEHLGLTRMDERRPGEATLNTALPEADPVAPIEDLAQGLDAVGTDSTQFGFDAPDRDQDPWPETEPPEPVSDPFGYFRKIPTILRRQSSRSTMRTSMTKWNRKPGRRLVLLGSHSSM